MPIGDPLLVGIGNVGSDATDGIVGNGLGLWEVTVEPMAEGKYNFFAQFEDAAGTLADRWRWGRWCRSIRTWRFRTTARSRCRSICRRTLGPIVDLNVTINIEHRNVGDLEILLMQPGRDDRSS